MSTKTLQNFINGSFSSSATANYFDNINPVDGSVISSVAEANSDDVAAAVAAARAALTGPWGDMSPEDRAGLLHRVADGVVARFDEFLAAECADTGKPSSLARHIDIPRGAANFKVFADLVKNVATEAFQMGTPDGAGAVN